MLNIKKLLPTSMRDFLKDVLGIKAIQDRMAVLEDRVKNIDYDKERLISLQNRPSVIEEPLKNSSLAFPGTREYLSIKTMVCRLDHFNTTWYYRWIRELYGMTQLEIISQEAIPQKYHRKNWEWCAITQALWERGFLTPGKRGLGFAVGNEPLPSLFAKYGVSILATDLDSQDERAESWKSTNQYSGCMEALWKANILPYELFKERVNFQYADMKNVTTLKEKEKFDFVWSSCALEHLGSLADGIDFVLNSSALLKPGGIGVHTTEFNVVSNENTVVDGSDVIYRKCDLENLDYILRSQGMCLEEMDFRPGTSSADRQYDTPPYYQSGKHHIKLSIGDYVTTSLIFIVYA
jgi:hypothetical protein